MSRRTAFQPHQVHPSAYIARGAVVLGDVELAQDASVWFNAVVRGDTESVKVGAGSNIQDLAVLHADPGFPCRLGRNVSVGHSAIVHGAIVEDRVLIGMGAIIMNGAVIGAGSIIGAGTIVTENKSIPAGSLVVGSPGRVLRATTEIESGLIDLTAAHYVEAIREYRDAEPPSSTDTR